MGLSQHLQGPVGGLGHKYLLTLSALLLLVGTAAVLTLRGQGRKIDLPPGSCSWDGAHRVPEACRGCRCDYTAALTTAGAPASQTFNNMT